MTRLGTCTRAVAAAIAATWFLKSATAHADVQIYINEFLEWIIHTPNYPRRIDFETLPDGRRTTEPVLITPEYNYTHLGMTFSAPPDIHWFGLTGNLGTGFNLAAVTEFSWQSVWIDADFVRPTRAVGAFFPGNIMLSVYDVRGNVLASQVYSSPGPGHFIGFISDIPIGRIKAHGGNYTESIEALWFDPIPEPGTAMLLLLAAGALSTIRRPRGR